LLELKCRKIGCISWIKKFLKLDVEEDARIVGSSNSNHAKIENANMNVVSDIPLTKVKISKERVVKAQLMIMINQICCLPLNLGNLWVRFVFYDLVYQFLWLNKALGS